METLAIDLSDEKLAFEQDGCSSGRFNLLVSLFGSGR